MASLLTNLDSKCSCEPQTYLSNTFLAIPPLGFSEASQTHMCQTGHPDVLNATFSPRHFPVLVNGKCAFLAVCAPNHDVTSMTPLLLFTFNHGQIPAAILFNLSQVWQPSVPTPSPAPTTSHLDHWKHLLHDGPQPPSCLAPAHSLLNNQTDYF